MKDRRFAADSSCNVAYRRVGKVTRLSYPIHDSIGDDDGNHDTRVRVFCDTSKINDPSNKMREAVTRPNFF